MARFEVREGSQTNHCCFEYTVVDTTKPDVWIDDEGHKVQIGTSCAQLCECFDRLSADTIVNALNKVDEFRGHTTIRDAIASNLSERIISVIDKGQK